MAIKAQSPADLKWTKLTFELNTGAKIPSIGLGTWQSKPGEVREAVKSALKAGYRYIDTALAYGNEKEVGLGIKDSGVPREEIWITTKLDNTWHHVAEEGIESSLQSLGVDYVDLYLMVSVPWRGESRTHGHDSSRLTRKAALAFINRPKEQEEALDRLELRQDVGRTAEDPRVWSCQEHWGLQLRHQESRGSAQ